jgi:group I intron endonuclease
MATIYVIKNNINGKMYVGQTTMGFKRRLACHLSLKKYILGNAIEKYGINNFTFYVYSGIPVDLLDYFEIEMIKRLNTVSPNGYNINLGGQSNRIFSQETRDRISQARTGTHHSYGYKISLANKGRVKSAEEKKNISNGLKGKLKSKEHIARMVASRIKNKKNAGDKNPSAKKVICIETGDIFTTMKEASEVYGLSISGVCQCCTGAIKACHGWHWEYYTEKE